MYQLLGFFCAFDRINNLSKMTNTVVPFFTTAENLKSLSAFSGVIARQVSSLLVSCGTLDPDLRD